MFLFHAIAKQRSESVLPSHEKTLVKNEVIPVRIEQNLLTGMLLFFLTQPFDGILN